MPKKHAKKSRISTPHQKKPSQKSFSFSKIHFIFSSIVSILFLIVSIFIFFHISHAASNPIQAENSLPGTSSWNISNPNTAHDMEGFANKTSVAAGDTVTFYIHTPTPVGFTADVYRMGWYQGLGARYVNETVHVSSSDCSNLTTDYCNTKSIIPTPNANNDGLVEANWKPSFSFTIPSSWVSGVYLVKLTADSAGKQSYVRFVVKNPSYASPLVFIFEDNTDEAYNLYGGASLYADQTKTLSYGRALKVSFNRPFVDNYGFGKSMSWDYPLIRWVEENGYDITYVSDTDVDSNPSLLLQHTGILVGGHAEYWSHTARGAVDNAVANGVNVAVFGANSFYWQIRYDLDSFGHDHRTIISYKDPQTGGVYKDPIYSTNKSLDTAQFRDSGSVNNPEQNLLGAMYSSYFSPSNTTFPWIVNDPNNWIMQGTGAVQGTTVNNIVGYEYDKTFSNYPVPTRLNTISYSPVVNVYGSHDVQATTIHQPASNAFVFDAATVFWSWGLDNWKSPYYASRPNAASAIIQKITANILNKFSTGLPPTQVPTNTPTPTIDPNATPTPTVFPTNTPTPTTKPTPTPTPKTCINGLLCDNVGDVCYNGQCRGCNIDSGNTCSANKGTCNTSKGLCTPPNGWGTACTEGTKSTCTQGTVCYFGTCRGCNIDSGYRCRKLGGTCNTTTGVCMGI